MYKIIGADQKEYGPVSGDQIRRWIAEGRLSSQSQARAEGEEEWKPLSAFAEFSEALGVPPPAPVLTAQPGGTVLPGGEAREAAVRAVKGPAIALIIIASLACVFASWGMISTAFFHPDTEYFSRMLQQYQDPAVREFMQRVMRMSAGPIGIASAGLHLAVSVVILLGALRMLNLQNYQWAFVASILAMVPCVTPACCCILGLPFGIWALVVLNRPEVKSQFL
jgi:hypothetical protein